MQMQQVMAAMIAGGVAASAMAGVRVIHASPNTPAVDVYVNTLPGAGAPAIEDLAFTQGTGYVPLPTGTYDFRVTPANATSPVAINATGVAIDGNTDYTIAAIDFFSNIRPLVLVDDRTQNPNAARIRFVHAAPDVPAVDVGLLNGSVLFDNTAFGNAADEGYITVPGGTYDLGVFLDGNNQLALPLPGITLQNNVVYTVFAMGSLAQGNVQAVIFADAIPTPGAAALLGLSAVFAGRRRR